MGFLAVFSWGGSAKERCVLSMSFFMNKGKADVFHNNPPKHIKNKITKLCLYFLCFGFK